MRSRHVLIVVLVIALAIIILPTGTPEDVFTTIPLLGVVGWKKYLVIIGLTLLLLLITYELFKKDFVFVAKKYSLF